MAWPVDVQVVAWGVVGVGQPGSLLGESFEASRDELIPISQQLFLGEPIDDDRDHQSGESVLSRGRVLGQPQTPLRPKNNQNNQSPDMKSLSFFHNCEKLNRFDALGALLSQFSLPIRGMVCFNYVRIFQILLIFRG